ncbi:MAG: undecaprenyl-phosphate glucose phosphotransferase [Methylococcaceae bacterium]|nr:undecaprenyl-phosphate glucose phosphotransferase [Methylococcaceae bacterium]
MREYATLLVILIKLLDWSLIVSGGVLSFYLLEASKNFPTYQGLMPSSYLNALGIAFLLSAWWFPAFNVYKSWRGESLFDEVRTLLLSWGVSMVALLVFMVFTKTTTEFSRHWLGLWFGLVFAGLVLSRITLRLVLRYLRKKGLNQRHIVLVGSSDLTAQVAKRVQASDWMGLEITGFFSDENNTIDALNPLGDLSNIVDYVEQHDVDQVWLTLSLKEMDKIETICRQLHSVSVEVLLIPDISSLRLLNHSVSQIDGMPVINMSVSPMKGTNALVKWLEDKLLSAFILLLISPLMLLIALAVKLSSPGSVFYRQERISWNGKRFQMLKFRSMPVDSDKNIVWGHAKSKHPTRVGQFLRKTSLDELPQFINVLKGDMSIVGPRPERTVFVEQFKHEIDCYMQKHLVQAGITGWAQVNGWRGDTCLQTRVKYDLYYVENWSLWFDLKIIVMTMFKVFNHEEAI